MDVIVCLTKLSTNCTVSKNSKSFVLSIKWERPIITNWTASISHASYKETHKPGVGRERKTKASDGPWGAVIEGTQQVNPTIASPDSGFPQSSGEASPHPMELPVTLPTSSPQIPTTPTRQDELPAVPKTRWGSSGLRACGSPPSPVCPHLAAWCSPFWLGRELHPGKPTLSPKADGVRRQRSQRRQAPLGLALRLLQATQRPLPRCSEEPRMQGLGLPAVSSVTSVPAGHSKSSIGDDRQNN